MKAALGTILMVLTSSGQMDNGKPTGVWLEEFAVPYQLFVDAGYTVEMVSLTGGPVPIDERSLTPDARPKNADSAIKLLSRVGLLSYADPDEYDAVFFPGGHGTMFDLPGSDDVHSLVRNFLDKGKPTAFVCHGPAALVGVKDENGDPVVKGRRVTGFTNEEEAAVELTEDMPFLLETRLRELGADFVPGEKFRPNVVVDGNLVTGQNPPSSEGAAREVLKLLSAE